MPEAIEKKFEKGPRKTETDSYLESLNPELWQEISSLSPEARDERWVRLTQKHLKDYAAGRSVTEEFELRELEFLYLNRFAAKNIPSLNKDMPQRGFFSFPKERMEKIALFGNLIDRIKAEAGRRIKENSRPFWILVGGIGISGKATLRNILARELAEACPELRIISWDRDYQKIFPPKWPGDINIVEDVHGLNEERDENGKLKRFDGSEGLPNGYDMVAYSLSPAVTFRQNLIRRGIGWLRAGKMDLTAPEKTYPPGLKDRIKETADELERFLPIARDWFREQIGVLRTLKKRDVGIAVVDPTEIFKKLYGFEEKKGIPDESFLESLKKAFQ